MAQRSEIFELRYESTDSFLSFYSTTKGLIHKLKTNKSITVTDETFLKSYFAKVTKAPALQQEVKTFIKGGSNMYDEILEFIHLDYRAQEMGEVLRDNVTHPTKPSSLCQGKTDNKGSSNKVTSTPIVPIKFPTNKGSLIATHIYV